MNNMVSALLAGGAVSVAGGFRQARLGEPNKGRSVNERQDFKRRRPLAYWFAEHNLHVAHGFYAVGLAMILAGGIGWLVVR